MAKAGSAPPSIDLTHEQAAYYCEALKGASLPSQAILLISQARKVAGLPRFTYVQGSTSHREAMQSLVQGGKPNYARVYDDYVKAKARCLEAL